jgi:tetratricopeptide (TPR) repeat protein
MVVAVLLLISWSGSEAAGAFEQGLRLYEGNQRKEAIAYFDRAVADDPTRKEVWLYRGRAYGETRNDGEAFRSYERALRLDPCYAEAFFQRGRTYLWNSNPEQAIRDFSSAIRCDGKVSKYYLNRASAHHQAFTPDMLSSQVHYKAAISDYAEAIRLDPQNWNAFAARCAFDYDFLDYRAGLTDCNEAIRLNRNDAGLYANRAAILHALGRREEAGADAARAIGIDPAMRDFINDTIRAHDRAEATRRQMLEEFGAGAGSGRDPCSSYSGSAQRACRAHDMSAAGRLGGGGGTRDDQQKYGR